jgi:hypothetical protein
VPLTRRCFRLARGPLGGTAETPRTSCNSRVDGKISVIFPSFVHLSLRVRRSRPVRSEKRIDRTLELLYTKDASETELTVKPGSVDVGGH